jgi:Fe-S-cluster containining protein
MDKTLIEFDGKRGRIIFQGNCLEMRTSCQAYCCRKDWKVRLSAEEYASGRYQGQAFCLLTEKACLGGTRPCANRGFQLSKREDHSCVYLQDNSCGIYDQRPLVCREFHCTNGWELQPVMINAMKSPDQKSIPSMREQFLEHLTEDAVFVPQPLMKVHAVFCLKPRREIIFVKEMIGACGKFNTRDPFDHPQLNSDHILTLIGLFNRKETLGQIYRRFCSHVGGDLTQPEFHSIVWLLNKHQIVLNSTHFRGMLSGIGGIG